MFTDMVGYTALGQRNESLSLALVDEQRKVIRPILSRHSGREVKTIGDAFLVEFPNAVDAVRCAYDIQRAIREFNLSLDADKRIHMRIGVHVGEVVESQGDISGDAVNVASRIESLAEDGGVCITSFVHDFVRGKVDLPLKSVGPKTLKNVTTPVEVYRMVMPWEKEQAKAPLQSESKRIAVLPFVSMSPDPNDEFFADGITEEVISTSSKIRGLSVISRTSVMRYKETDKSTVEIGRELNAGRVLEGSVRKSGNRVRVTVQLIDAGNDEHLWAETYDRDLQDIFEIQSDIARKVAESMESQLLERDREEIRRGPTRNPEAHVAYLSGLYFMHRASEESYPKAIRNFEKAIAVDPSFALAYAALADCYTYMAGQYLPSKTAFPKAKALATKALELDDSLAEGHTALGNVLMQYDWNWIEAGEEFTRAIELKANYSVAHLWRGIYLALMRRAEEGIKELEKAEELDPLSALVKLNVGVLLYYVKRYDDAVAKLREAMELERDEMIYLVSGWSYLAESMFDEAIAEMKKGASLGDYADILGGLGYAYGLSGKRAEALEVLAKLEGLGKKALNLNTNVAMIYLGLGEHDKALDFIGRALANREEWLALTCQTPVYDSVRSDPRFRAVVEKIGLPLNS